MTSWVSSIIAILGALIVMAMLVWGALAGNRDREAEAAARDHYGRTGAWPDGEGD